MLVLSAPGYGFTQVRYSRTGKQLLAIGRFSASWMWDLATSKGVKLASTDPPLHHCLYWRLPHSEAFLRSQGYWPESEEWPAAGPLRRVHRRVGVWAEDTSRSLCFTPDGQGMLLDSPGELYRTPDQLATWDFKGKIRHRFALEDPSDAPGAASFSSDGRLVALAFFRNLEVRDANTDKILIQTGREQQIQQHALSPDDNWAAIAAGRIVSTVDVRKRLGAHRFPAFKATVEALAFSPDSRLLAAGSREGRVRLWEVASGRELADLALRKSDVEHLAFSPDGQTLAVACKDKCVVILDVDV